MYIRLFLLMGGDEWMERFTKIFSNAMELNCLGLYEKVKNKSDQERYKHSAGFT